MIIHYDVTGLLTVVWRSHSGQLSGLSELAREEAGSVLIARDIQESAGKQVNR